MDPRVSNSHIRTASESESQGGWLKKAEGYVFGSGTPSGHVEKRSGTPKHTTGPESK
jgi:hypothetical protein